jgi:outer membrane protein OmpA-like peptidoglycan-associated protein
MMLGSASRPAKAQDGGDGNTAPKWEIYGGYSFFYPHADVDGVLSGGSLPVSSRLESNPRGAGASVTFNFKRWIGLTVDASTDWGSGESGLGSRLDDTAFSNLSLGPKITFRHTHFSPFLEALVGDHRLMPDAFHDIDKLGIMAGGGLDINLSRHVALRLIRADYVFSNYRYGPSATTAETEIRGVRLQAGLNFMFGGDSDTLHASADCSAEPDEVFAGDPVTARSRGSSFNPRRTVKYSWSGSGIGASNHDSSTTIETSGLQPGPYQVTANSSDGSGRGVASCSARFRVKQPRPPEVACASDPESVRVGNTTTIISNASSPDHRRLRYSYTTTSGNISGADPTATLNTGGAEPGSITVTCIVSDDRNPALTASAMTKVRVEPLPPVEPPAEIAELEAKLALHSIYFQTARPTQRNPGGGLVESQEQVLVALAGGFTRYLTYRPEAHLILGGFADLRGSVSYNKDLTQRRVDRTKNFLVQHGVPTESIEVRSYGKEDELSSEQIKEQIAQNPDISQGDRNKMLNNLPVIVLANNRRVDVSLSTTGQQSTRRYPFNAKDALGLISTTGVGKEAPRKKKLQH